MTDPNPLEKYFEEKTATQENRKQNELEMWQKWRDGGMQPEHLEPLLKAYANVFNQKVRAWKPKMVPESAFHAELQGHAIKAFQSYDPSRGAALNTHVIGRLKKSLRYGNLHANMGYLPEGQSNFIGPIDKARDTLTESLGREPTPHEIHEVLQQDPDRDFRKLTPQRIETIQANRFKDIPMSRSAGPDNYDYGTSASSPTGHAFEEQQIAVAQDILPQLFPARPELHVLFNHIYGTNGHEQISSTGALAQKMGKTSPQISRMKSYMGQVLRKHMGLDNEE